MERYLLNSSRGFWVCLSFFIAGLFSQISQIILIREILVIFGGNEISFGFFYGFWLTWIALGSTILALLDRFFSTPSKIFLVSLGSLPIALGIDLFFVKAFRVIFAVPSHDIIPLTLLLVSTFFITLPIGLLIGFLFPSGCKILAKHEAISFLYALESLGSLLAGILFTFFLVHHADSWIIIYSLTILIGILVLIQSKSKNFFVSGIVITLTGAIFLISPLGNLVRSSSENIRWTGLEPKLTHIESFDTPYQHIDVARFKDQISILGDGHIFSSFPDDPGAAQTAAITMSQVPQASHILLLGGAMTPLIPELLKYPVGNIDVVEQDSETLKRVYPYLTKKIVNALEDSKCAIHFGDARSIIKGFTKERKEYYDLVLSFLPDPGASYINRYYSLEFYMDIKKILAPSGVYVTQSSAGVNYMGKEVKNYTYSIYHTLNRVFSQVIVAPGTQYMYFASCRGQASVDPDVLASRYREIPLHSRTFLPENFAQILDKERSQKIVEAFKQDQDFLINTDLKPITYYLSIMLWEKISESVLLGPLNLIYKHGLALILVILGLLWGIRLIFVILYPNKDSQYRFNATFGIGVVGFSAMAVQIILLFSFQNLYGYLFEKIGLLNGLFMFGLGIGAFAGRILIKNMKKPWLDFALALLVLAFFSFSLPSIIIWAKDSEAPEILFWLMVCASGLITGFLFPLAVFVYSQWVNGIGRISGILQASDSWGGAFGGFLLGGFLIPLTGIQTSSLLLGATLVSVVVLIAISAVSKNFSFKFIHKRAFVSFPCLRVSWAFFSVFIILWVLSLTFEEPKKNSVSKGYSNEDMSYLMPLHRFEFVEKPYPHYRVYENDPKSREIKGIITGSLQFSSDIKGYGGEPLHLLIALSPKGEILGIKLIHSNETPSYIVGIDAWLARLTGKRGVSLALKRDGIDAMTGATVTSEAVIETIRKSSLAIEKEILENKDSDLEAAQKSYVFDLWAIPVSLLMIFAVFCYKLKKTRLRLVVLACSVVLMGLMLNRLFTEIDIANLSQGNIPPLSQTLWYTMAAFIIVTGIAWGPIFCGFICPFGALQEIFSLLGERAGLLTKAPEDIEWMGRYIKYVVLCFILVFFWITGHWAWITFDPMQNFFRWGIISTSAILLAIFSLAGSLFYFRFWCRYFCPTGAFLALFNKIGLLESLGPKRNFKRCDIGVKAPFDVDCIRCMRCMRAEEHGQIEK